MDTDKSMAVNSPQDPYAPLRQRMVEQQIRPRGVRDPRVLAAMSSVPREQFVPEPLRSEAYDDWPLPIGHGQTISQPFTVAFMAEALLLRGDETVLEVGTGSGYGAAVLSRLARLVYTVERVAELAESARLRLRRLGYTNVEVRVTDGTLGLPDHSPYDALVVTAGAERLPAPYWEQLAEGGRIVIPIGPHDHQSLYRFTKVQGAAQTENLGSFAFVPLIGRHGWPE